MRDYTNEEIIKMYEGMVLGRVYQEEILVRIAAAKMTTGFYHLSIGTESVAVGIMEAMRQSDYIMPTHRMHSLLLGMLDIKDFTAELMGRATGYGHGKSFEFSIGVPERHMLPKETILASGGPYSVGAAMALKLDKKDGVVITCWGDGTTSEGNVHESMNLASVFQVPIVFVIDNNGWAMSQPLRDECAITNLADRAAAYGMRGVTVDGHDVLVVRDAMEEAIALARKGQPGVVELKTIRHRGHFEGDPQSYRDDLDTIGESLKNDCLARLEKVIAEKGILDKSGMDAIWEEKKRVTLEAFAYAEEQPMPDRALTIDPHEVYANIPGGTK